MESSVYFNIFYLTLLSIVYCEDSKTSMGSVVSSVSETIHQTVEHTGVVGNSVQPCDTLHQTASIVNVPDPSPVLPPVMIPIIPKLPKIKPQFVEVLRPTLAPVVIPIPALPQVKPVAAVLPPAPCVTYMEIPLPKPKPFKIPIIPKLPPIKYMEVELPAPASLRIPVLPKPAPPKFVQIEMPVIAPVKIAPLPKIAPLVLPALPKIELPVFKPMPVVYMPQPVPVHTIQTQVLPCVQAMPMPCPCSSCMQSYGPPAHPCPYDYNKVPMHHGPYHNYAHQGYTGYQQSLHASIYSGPNPYGSILPSSQHQHLYNGPTHGFGHGFSHVESPRIQTIAGDVRSSEGTVIALPNLSNLIKS